MNIIVSANDNEEILVFPVIPRGIMLENTSNNEEFQTIDSGTINILGDEGLKKVNITSLFPKNKETWSKAGSVEGQKYIDFFNKWKSKKEPIRLIMTLGDSREWVNMLCSIEQFNYGFDKVENINYDLILKEFRGV